MHQPLRRPHAPNPNSPPAVVLLSGGLDSATVLAMARRDGRDCIPLSVDYGQRHRVELDAARHIAASLGVTRHIVVPIDLRAIGGSALTADIDVPDHSARSTTAAASAIPVTYVPARNMIMLSLAVGLAEVVGASEVHIGVNQLDYSGYPDCREEFIQAFEQAAALGTRAGNESRSGTEADESGGAIAGRGGIRIVAPLIHMTKAQIIRAGHDLGVDYSITISCYNPAPLHAHVGKWGACGRCDSCFLRREGFRQAGVADPTPYAPGNEGA